jgi:uncharacterized protein YigA (DUF484 family)
MSAMFPDEIADYLKNNPSFFEQYADLMAQIFVPHPHGGRAVSLAERQMLTLREKNRTTESKLAELIAFGEENDAISEKVHRLAVALIAAETFQAVIHLLNFHLRDDFSVPHVALRLWDKPEGIEDCRNSQRSAKSCRFSPKPWPVRIADRRQASARLRGSASTPRTSVRRR